MLKRHNMYICLNTNQILRIETLDDVILLLNLMRIASNETVD